MITDKTALKFIGFDPAVGGDKMVIASWPPYETLTFSDAQSARSDMKRRMNLFYENLNKSWASEIKALTEIITKRDRMAERLKERMMISLHQGDITYLEHRRLRMKPLSFMDMVKRDIKRNKSGEVE